MKSKIELFRNSGDAQFADFNAFDVENRQLRLAQNTPCAFSAVDRVAKRVIDIVLSILMLLFFAPIFVTISVYILVVYKISPIFCHTRIGLHGKRFGCYKFRTMVPDADAQLAKLLASDTNLRDEWMTTRKLTNDPRILPGIGKILRKSSLDELPQVLNVLFGHMSMVGPRPVTEGEMIKYGSFAQHYVSVRPGITGAWQIGGRSGTSYADRVSIDVWYVENANIRLDLQIFMKTICSFCSGRLSGGV